ncbi:hypothetical protein; putative nucleoside triphosphate hydrolase domain [Rhodospirillaceae bacterium LM-1]|nr:hypothetical protein; putative nucleoside triphosphate hydrolase domain [Rhodospirillaceae bacterium LM-1]
MTDAPASQNKMSQTSAHAAPARVVIVTGMSGAGRTSALKALEDLGYEAVDNLPLSLFAQLVRPDAILERPLAVGIDIRTRDFGVNDIDAAIARMILETPVDVKLLFLDADDDALARRFTETRRRHPLATDRPLIDGIQHERALLAPLKLRADLVIDSSRLAIGEFRHLMEAQFGLESRHRLVLFVTSFSYRQGLPREADLVFDARFLINPHYVPELKPLTGRDAQVAAYVAADPSFDDYFSRLTGLLAPLLPRFAAEGKSYLTIAIGCTGGRHRSVFVAERLADWLSQQGQAVELRHRELSSLT